MALPLTHYLVEHVGLPGLPVLADAFVPLSPRVDRVTLQEPCREASGRKQRKNATVGKDEMSDSSATPLLGLRCAGSGLLQAYHIRSGDKERCMPQSPGGSLIVQRWRALLTLGVMVKCLPSANEEHG